MELERAQLISREIAGILAPACRRIELAGSVRRGKPDVHDVEFVFEPKLGLRAVDLFESETYPLTDDVLATLQEAGTLASDDKVKRWGPKYKRCVHVASGLVIELFAADSENWGYILALRTGPYDFNKVLVRQPWHGGALPLGVRLVDGYVYRDGCRLPVPTEEDFFTALNLPCWPPAERSEGRILAHLAAREARL